MGISLQKLFKQGSSGSGFHGHEGRKGKVGGSLPRTRTGLSDLAKRHLKYDREEYINKVDRILDEMPLSPRLADIAGEINLDVREDMGGSYAGHFGNTIQVSRGVIEGRFDRSLGEAYRFAPTVLHGVVAHELGHHIQGRLEFDEAVRWNGLVTDRNLFSGFRKNKLPDIEENFGSPLRGNELFAESFALYMWDPNKLPGPVLDYMDSIAMDVKHNEQKLFRQGGPGSGFHGHVGRKDEVGGSLPRGGSSKKSKFYERVNKAAPNAKGYGSFLIDGKGNVYKTDYSHDEAAEALGYGDSDSFIDDRSGIRIAYSRNASGQQETNFQTKNINTKTLERLQSLWSEDKVSIIDGAVVWASGYSSDVHTTIIPTSEFLSASTVQVRDRRPFLNFDEKGKLFLHGGPGSGFHGHRGRPGEVGGSSKEDFAVGDLTPEQREERLRKRRERRARKKGQGKGQPPQQPPQPQQPVYKSPHQLRAERIVKELGYPEDKLTAHGERGPAFTVNGKTMYTGASFSPTTGEIKIYNVHNLTDEQITGMLAHEVQHSRWNDYRAAYQQQAVEVHRSVVANPLDESKWLITDQDTRKLIPSADKEKFWAYSIHNDFMEDEGRWIRLQSSDGISAYSKEYWAQARQSGSSWDYDRAVDETLAEIARIQTGNARAGDKKAIRPIWQSLYNRVRKHTVKKNQRLFLFGGPGSGFRGHRGRIGEVGGSSKEGGSSMDKVVLKDLSGATARAEHDGSIAIDPNRWKDVSEASRRGILAHELAHQTVEDYVLNNNEEWDRAVEFLQLEKNDRSPSGYLFIGGNTRIGEAITDAISVYITDGTFGREPSTDWRSWAEDVVKKSGHSKKALANRVDDIVRQANRLL